MSDENATLMGTTQGDRVSTFVVVTRDIHTDSMTVHLDAYMEGGEEKN